MEICGIRSRSINILILNYIKHTSTSVSIAPLIVYRILFGLMVCYGGLWSIAKGDIQSRFLEPSFFFKYYGFEWVGYVGASGIYCCYFIWLISSLGIIFGAYYRFCIGSFFIVFSYLHLLDATNYINHYYAISIFALLLGMLPANAAVSIDAWRNAGKKRAQIPFYYIGVFQFQIAVIYSFAAIGKINSDWLLGAMPLKIWLLQSQDFPILGVLFQYHWMHLLVSWIGFLFDLTIVYWLWNKRTRKWAYVAVLCFHSLTGMLFNIGLFPMLMLVSTLVFFAPSRQLAWLERLGFKIDKRLAIVRPNKMLAYFFVIYMAIQIALPLRHYFLYDNNILWSEEGYRFSWRVMLVEKEGMATFYVNDPNSERHWVVTNQDFLTPFQEKRMAVRPDHILQFAHHLAAIYAKRYDIEEPVVNADVFVALNGRVSQPLIDPTVNLVKEKRSIFSKDWILSFEK